jgi:hypothetical protein
VYILILLLFTARLSSANSGYIHRSYNIAELSKAQQKPVFIIKSSPTDTNRIKSVPQSHMDVLGSRKIKEVAKPKHQSKPEKVVAPVDTAAINKKAKRQRRPEGLERPPEIPRRNND